MRLRFTAIASLASLLVATSSNAFTFELAAGTTPPRFGIGVGEQITLEIVMSRDGAEAVASIGATIYGWNPAVVAFNSGVAVANAGATAPLFFGILPIGSIANQAGVAGAPNPSGNGQFNRDIGAGDIIAPGVLQFFSGVQPILPTPVGDDAMDLGIDGIPLSAGGISARLVFDVIAPGLTGFVIGGDGNLGGVVTVDNGVARTDQYVNAYWIPTPEPGTGLLVGLGLAGLGAVGRHERHHRS